MRTLALVFLSFAACATPRWLPATSPYVAATSGFEISLPAGWMRRNLTAAGPKGETIATVGTYFSFYALGALYHHGRAAEAEDFIRHSWGWLLDRGAWTCWENWPQTDSLCHAWSTAPTWYLSSQVLGIQFPEAGDPDVVRIAPQPGTLQWARGVYPHPRGPICVEWQREGDRFLVKWQAPEGVRIANEKGM